MWLRQLFPGLLHSLQYILHWKCEILELGVGLAVTGSWFIWANENNFFTVLATHAPHRSAQDYVVSARVNDGPSFGASTPPPPVVFGSEPSPVHPNNPLQPASRPFLYPGLY